jgi:hypothetical protein
MGQAPVCSWKSNEALSSRFAGRPWLVEAVDDTQPDLTTVRLSCIADDTQGEQIEGCEDRACRTSCHNQSETLPPRFTVHR